MNIKLLLVSLIKINRRYFAPLKAQKKTKDKLNPELYKLLLTAATALLTHHLLLKALNNK